jgi:hypothetical protein
MHLKPAHTTTRVEIKNGAVGWGAHNEKMAQAEQGTFLRKLMFTRFLPLLHGLQVQNSKA